MKKFFSGLIGFVFMTLVVLFMVGEGATLILRGSGERKLKEAPEVALAGLAKYAGKTVRVRGRLSGQPSLQAANGAELAFQAVVISHEESSGSGQDSERKTVTDYAQMAPQALVLGDGAHTVGVLPSGVDVRFVPEQAKGSMGPSGRLPAGAAGFVSPAFTGFPDQQGADVSVRGIAEGAEVTVHGTVALSSGGPVLTAPQDLPFVISPLPFEQVLKKAASSGMWHLVFGWIMVLGGVAVAATQVSGLFRRRQPEAA